MSSIGDSRFVSFFKGFLVTGKQPAKPKVTVQYPEEKRRKPERFHGRHGGHVEAGFLPDLAPDTCGQGFSQFQHAPRNRPLAFERLPPPADEQDLISVDHDAAHSHNWTVWVLAPHNGSLSDTRLRSTDYTKCRRSGYDDL